MKTTIEVLPSLLAADMTQLALEVARLEQGEPDAWHIDVMDGHFVPNITFGPSWVEALRPLSGRPFDVHLMMYNPHAYIERFISAGADRLTFHVEATEDILETIEFIHACGKQAGLAINPETSVHLLEPFLAHVDQVLVMTVSPGFGGQAFDESCVEKIRYLAQLRSENDLRQALNKKAPLRIQVDGGIDFRTGKVCVEAGADSLVSGTFLLRQEDTAQAIKTFKDFI
jgi:ribulose-phosphate 3-epimerase